MKFSGSGVERRNADADMACGWAENTVANVVSAIRKAMQRKQSGGNCRSVRRAEKLPGRAQRQLLMDGTAVESAFALLSTKVTKPMRRIRR